MRIAFVDYVLEPHKPGRSGLSDVVWDMASELVNQGHEAHIVASYHTQNYPDRRVIVHNFPTPPIGYRNIVGHFWLLKRAADIVNRLQPDIVHAPEYVSTAVFATLGIKSPLVLTTPGNVFHRIRYGHSYEWYYLQILKWAARVSAKRCARIIAVSREMKKWWEWTGSTPDRTIYIPYGVNTQRFYPVPDARSKLGLPQGKQIFLYVGRFAREKGLLDLIDALSRIKHLLDPEAVEVILIGQGPQEQEIRHRISTEGLDRIVQIRSWASQDQLSMWYSAADALLLPSHTEALSRVILEAMACGTPVIGSRITGTGDIVDEIGYLFPPGDIQALADILGDLIRYPEKQKDLHSSALRYISEHLTWNIIMKRVVNEVYNLIFHGSNDFLDRKTANKETSDA